MREKHLQGKCGKPSNSASLGDSLVQGSNLDPHLNYEILEEIAEDLVRENQIGWFSDQPKGFSRDIPLQVDCMFNSLVELYSCLFRAEWRSFRHIAEAFSVQGQPQVDHEMMAQNYIATWFCDLYYHLWKAAKDYFPPFFQQFFAHEFYPILEEYDFYLVMLMEAIRPAITLGALAQTRWFPTFGDIDPVSDNDTGYRPLLKFEQGDPNLAVATVEAMRMSRNWRVKELKNVNAGRCGWLLDWHENGAYAWFPSKENYTHTDLPVFFILGVACTPHQALRDTDDWQPLGSYKVGQNVRDLARVEERCFFGSMEFREVEVVSFELTKIGMILKEMQQVSAATTDSASSKMQKRQRDTEIEEITSSTEDMVAKMMRIIDYCYHSQVIRGADFETRMSALRMICLKGTNISPGCLFGCDSGFSSLAMEVSVKGSK